jgi:hypothetical protein
MKSLKSKLKLKVNFMFTTKIDASVSRIQHIEIVHHVLRMTNE